MSTAEAAAATVFGNQKPPSTPPAKGNKKKNKGILKNKGTPHAAALHTVIKRENVGARDPRLRGKVVQAVACKAPRSRPPPLARTPSEHQDVATFTALLHHRTTSNDRKWEKKLREAEHRYDILSGKYEDKCRDNSKLTIQCKAALAAARNAQGHVGRAAQQHRRHKETVQTVVGSVGKSVAAHETYCQREVADLRSQIKHCFDIIEARIITHVEREHRTYKDTFDPIRFRLIDGGASSPPAKKGRQ